MTVAALLHKVLGRPSHDRIESPDPALVDTADIAFRPDLMVRWDDETAITAPFTCSRVPSRRARRASASVTSSPAAATR